MTHKVVSVQCDVEGTSLHATTGNASKNVCYSLRNRDTTPPDTNQRDIVDTTITFNNFVCNAGECPPDAFRFHHYRHMNLN